jgi:hypothetical protein
MAVKEHKPNSEETRSRNRLRTLRMIRPALIPVASLPLTWNILHLDIERGVDRRTLCQYL